MLSVCLVVRALVLLGHSYKRINFLGGMFVCVAFDDLAHCCAGVFASQRHPDDM